ncbi:hypothetical protein [Nocardioides nanhaiensis]|uniref:DUF1795 domain-containing protein n=1 Tax=Nocardioides nanhaiensis TaxID=1476871 RepID=A0ABP8VSP7_9ACTN
MSTPRAVVALVALALLGAGAGFGVATQTGDDVVTEPTAAPLAASPSLPGADEESDEPEPYAEDIDYRTLVPPTRFVTYRIGNDVQAWRYLAPRGWQAYSVPDDVELPPAQVDSRQEVRFRPPDEPVEGGYSLRVKAVNDHVPPATMLADKLRALRLAPTSFPDLTLLERTDDSLYFTYRTPSSNRLRYNFFRWFAAPGAGEASLEMSVVGRARDEVGLRGLFDQFRDGLRPVS